MPSTKNDVACEDSNKNAGKTHTLFLFSACVFASRKSVFFSKDEIAALQISMDL